MPEIYKNPVKKIIPSKLETGFQQFLYKHAGEYIPKNMTPNQVTLVGALGGLFAVISTLLTWISPLFFIGTIAGLLVHLTADDLDGYEQGECLRKPVHILTLLLMCFSQLF